MIARRLRHPLAHSSTTNMVRRGSPAWGRGKLSTRLNARHVARAPSSFVEMRYLARPIFSGDIGSVKTRMIHSLGGDRSLCQ